MEEIFENVWGQAQEYGPKILWALLILLVAYILGKLVQWAISAGIKRMGLAVEGPKGQSLGDALGAAAFWVILLIGIIQALTRLELNQIADPLNHMVDQIMFYLPKVFGAAIVFAVFALVARVVKQTAEAVFTFADPVPEKLGLAKGNVNISGVSGTVLSALLYIIGAITALGVLDIPALSDPLSAILQDVLDVIPNVILASLLLAGFILIARFVSNLAMKTLPQTGLDTAISQLGLLKGADASLTPSRIVAVLASFFIILLGLIQALNVLNFDVLTEATYTVLDIGASVAFGALIIFAGVFVARLISGAMASAGEGASDVAASIVKWVVIGLAVILGISRMGLDPTGGTFVLDVAKLLALGAAIGLAGAIAIGFGWGGRDWFAKQLEKWRS